MRILLLATLLLILSGCSAPELTPVAQLRADHAALQIELDTLQNNYVNKSAEADALRESTDRMTTQINGLNERNISLEFELNTVRSIYAAYDLDMDAARAEVLAAATSYANREYELNESFKNLNDEYQKVLDRYPKYFSSASELDEWRGDSGNFTSTVSLMQSALVDGYIVGLSMDEDYNLVWVGGSLLRVWTSDNLTSDNLTWIKVR